MRKTEFIKKSEARVLIYLSQAENNLKHGGSISDKLKIDYIYLMKLFREMYQKGWVKVHQYNSRTYFDVTETAPLEEAKKKISEAQIKLKVEVKDYDRREIEKSCLAIKGS